MNTTSPSPTTLLIVLDGFGEREPAPDNAISEANTPVWDDIRARCPATRISGSGEDVGLPDGQMGNSEVGHTTIGAGRIVHQDLTRIDQAIEDGTFRDNQVLAHLMDQVAAKKRTLHVMGLVSPGGVHSHERQIEELIAWACERGVRVRLHAFLDGRDTPPRSAASSLRTLEARWPGVVASITGRFYAMDRDARWDRTERAYNLVQRGEAPFHEQDAVTALEAAYRRDEGDEFVQPTAIHGGDELPCKIEDGDGVVFMNFRADRARQLSRAFISEDFDGFERKSRAELGGFVTLTQYAEDIAAEIAFPPERPANTLGEYLEGLGKKQLRIAETEKYAHVTFFFSGGREEPFIGEERVLVPSPKVATYDLEPAMSAHEVTDRLVAAIDEGCYDLIVCNYANGDMVGHTGVFDAAVRAIEVLDECLGRIVAALRRTGSQCLITADHGNAECMFDAEGEQPHTAHTSLPVPCVYVGPRAVSLKSGGTLADIAPTLLTLMDLHPPKEMTGTTLACMGHAENEAGGSATMQRSPPVQR